MRYSHMYRVYIRGIYVGDTNLDFENMPSCTAKGFLLPLPAYQQFARTCAETFYTGQAHLDISIVRDDGVVPTIGTCIAIADPTLDPNGGPDIEIHVSTPTEKDIRVFAPFFR